MKTILFIDKGEKGLWPSFLKYDFLLDEFRKEGLFEVCEWRSGFRSVDEAIPDLAALIGPDDEWQAVVVTDLREDDASLRDDEHFDNPFDFRDRYDRGASEGIVESEHALVRLTHMLGGFPEKMSIEWPDRTDSPFDLRGYEVKHSLPEGAYDLIERYRLGRPRPVRIICVTPRDVDEAFFDCRKKELASCGAGEQIDFWQRNDYPAITRFVVCDRMQPAKEFTQSEDAPVEEDSAFGALAGGATANEAATRSEWFNFWMCILTIMTSTVEASDLRAYRVYNMSVDIDEQRLTEMFAQRRAQWVAAREVVEARVRGDEAKLHASEYVMTPLPDTHVSIPVTFDMVSTAGLYTAPSEVGFIKDEPEKDHVVWFRQKARIMDEFREVLRAPRRALRNAAAKFRGTPPVPEDELEYCILNEYQKDKLRDDLNAQESELARSVDKPPFRLESYEEEFAKRGVAIEEQIKLRPIKKQVVLSFAAAIVGTLVGFLPFIVGTSSGFEFSAEALGMALVCCLVLFGVGMFVLWSMQHDVRKRYLDHDELMNEVTSFLSGEALRLDRKVSSYATYRKRWQVMERQLHLDVPTKEASKLGYQSALLKTRIRDLDEVARNCEVAMSGCTFDYDIDWGTVSQWLKDDSFFNLCNVDRTSYLDEEPKYASRTFVDVPYGFIRGARLDELELE